MNKQRKIPRYKQIQALGDTSDMTAAEIADKLDLCVNDVTSAIYYARKDHGVDIPYVKVYGGRKRVRSKPKPPVAAKKAPLRKVSGNDREEYQVRDWRRCKGCKYGFQERGYGPVYCQYFLMTYKVRGCPAGDGCTKREGVY